MLPISSEIQYSVYLASHQEEVQQSCKAIQWKKEEQQFKFFYWNVGNIKWINKILDIQDMINEQLPDICFVTEANMEN